MESLNTLQRILNSIEASLGSGGPQLYGHPDGFVALFALLALLLVCYGMLWNGRVLPSAFGLLMRLALVTFALTQWPWFLDGFRDMARDAGVARHRRATHHCRLSRPWGTDPDGVSRQRRCSGRRLRRISA